jgi:electron transport complex protein RnfC
MAETQTYVKKEPPLFGILSFRGGVKIPLHKDLTATLKIEKLPSPPRVIIHCAQHMGTPAIPIVNQGDRVLVGQAVAEAAGPGPLSLPVHASISGTIVSVGPFPHPSGSLMTAVEIENDGNDEKGEMLPLDKPWKEAALGEIVQKIHAAGIAGMGGHGFPTHAKLSPPSNKPIDTLIVNGVECEPYLTADHRLMIEKTEELLTGTLIIRKVLAAKTTFLAVDAQNLDAIARVSELLSDPKFRDISLAKLTTKFPQGGEKQLVYALTKKRVPSGGLPMDVGCVVHNVATVFAVREAVCSGIPLYQRVVTAGGPALRSPKNLLVPVGTPIRFVLQNCAVDMGIVKKIVLGGAMTGMAQSEPDVPVMKSTTAILAFDRIDEAAKINSCIGCGACVRVCPMRLVPSFLAKYVDKNRTGEVKEWGVLDCIECGACAYVCPAKINLVHYMKLGRYWVEKQRKKGL